jgi:crotonobetainyl-CoA:carnitine CoA-transferase CaiB-like acyl-CoA transferase
MTGPLDGIRVIDLSSVLSGPIAAGVLADQGADVVKVEPPGVTDVTLKVGASRNGMTAMYHLANRAKRGVALDLHAPAGLAVFRRLVARADVLIQNFRPGVVERLGVAYDDLCPDNPTLVYLSITGVGPTGPLAGLKVYDNMIQAVSGFASVQSGPSGEPTCVRNLICDKITAWMGAQAVTAALLARYRTGAGSHVQISMLDAAVSFLWTDAATSYTLLGEGIRDAPTVGGAELTRHLDGWSTAVPATDDEFRGFCHAYGHPEVADDPRFATQAGRLGNPEYRRVYREVLQAAAAKLTVQEAMTRLETAGVAAVAVVDLGDVPHHQQVLANHTFVEHDDPVAGRLRQPRPAARFSGDGPASTVPPGAAPTPGQHTDEVLSELGYGAAEIAALRESGTLG